MEKSSVAETSGSGNRYQYYFEDPTSLYDAFVQVRKKWGLWADELPKSLLPGRHRTRGGRALSIWMKNMGALPLGEGYVQGGISETFSLWAPAKGNLCAGGKEGQREDLGVDER